MNILRLGILASTNATDMQAIIDAIASGELAGVEIAAVISNKQDCGALQKAKKHGIPHAWVDPKDFASREEYDTKVAQLLDEAQVDLVLMIGYMRIVTNGFVTHFRNRMLNVHPSLLPAFGGGMDRNVHQDVLDSGVKVTGCTIHLVTEQVDGGPIVYQKAVEIAEDETVESLKIKVQKLEQEGFVKILQSMIKGEISLS
ncbi:MAG TPA: phosphoribosylglycinamide formyltransferase [bacterium]|nr:phosphoribosylglycinamide formyltransferase [bacterium]